MPGSPAKGCAPQGVDFDYLAFRLDEGFAMSARKCVVCGEQGDITKDHVVPRLVLRIMLGREAYANFCSEVRKVNIQPMCGPDNNLKATRIADLRSPEEHAQLCVYLDKYGILDDIEFEDPFVMFGERAKDGEQLWLAK